MEFLRVVVATVMLLGESHRTSFGQVKDEFAAWLNPANAVIKAMVELP